jgi:DNA-binding MarR family transcriptional regulator
LSIDRTNVSRLVARMEGAGEVKRRTDSQDGRAKVVILTARGMRLAQSVDESSAMHFADVASGLEMAASTVIKSVQALGVAMTSQWSEAEQESE